MPFYEYALADGSDCDQCGGPRTLLQKINDPPMTICPDCRRPMKRIISAPHVVAGKGHHLKESNIEKGGFTQYKKIGKGVYEKTVGKGPGIISSGDD